MLIESVADHIIDTLFLQDEKVHEIEVKIVKLAIAEEGEEIGITMRRARESDAKARSRHGRAPPRRSRHCGAAGARRIYALALHKRSPGEADAVLAEAIAETGAA